jgi:mRNA-degrading endonuclease toxin of MazEF toxin-antitoxin module
MNARGGYGGPSTGYEGAGVSNGNRVESACCDRPANVPQHGQEKMAQQVRTNSKERIVSSRAGAVPPALVELVDAALRMHVGL